MEAQRAALRLKEREQLAAQRSRVADTREEAPEQEPKDAVKNSSTSGPAKRLGLSDEDWRVMKVRERLSFATQLLTTRLGSGSHDDRPCG